MDKARLLRRAAAAFLALTLALPGCRTRVIALYEKVVGSPGYAKVTQIYTRTREVHDGLETRFILASTWLSPDWVRAFSQEYANIYYLDAERKDRVISLWMEESEAHERFFVALFTPDERTNDMDRKGTLWSLHLVRADEKSFQPVYVRRTSLRPEEVSHFFPYSGAWFRSYEVAFPAEAREAVPVKAGSPRFKLVLSGVQGRAVLVWN